MAKRVLYNVTCHSQVELAGIPEVAGRWNVEVSPRLRIVNPSDWRAMKQMVRDALRGVPVGADIVVGGLSQIQTLISELGLYNIHYVLMRRTNGSTRSHPVGVVAHRGWSRRERYEIEQASQELSVQQQQFAQLERGLTRTRIADAVNVT